MYLDAVAKGKKDALPENLTDLITNLKAAKTRKRKTPFAMTTVADLKEWASACNTELASCNYM